MTNDKYKGSQVLTPFIKSATGAVAPNERVCHVVTSASADITLTLPPADTVEGLFAFKVITDGGHDLILQSPETTPVINLTFADANDYCGVYSTGTFWMLVANNGGS